MLAELESIGIVEEYLTEPRSTTLGLKRVKLDTSLSLAHEINCKYQFVGLDVKTDGQVGWKDWNEGFLCEKEPNKKTRI